MIHFIIDLIINSFDLILKINHKRKNPKPSPKPCFSNAPTSTSFFIIIRKYINANVLNFICGALNIIMQFNTAVARKKKKYKKIEVKTMQLEFNELLC